MTSTLQREAEERLTETLRDTGAVDPRHSCREFLRELRDRGGNAYEEAVSTFEDSVIRRIGQDQADPLATWLEYACDLAARLRPGRDVVIDGSGRAAPLRPPPSWRDLILHLPGDQRTRCLVVGHPPELTRAQRATVELLSGGAVKRPGT